VVYVGERQEGHHVCDVYVQDEWHAQIRFIPKHHRFHLFLEKGSVDPFGLKRMDYDQLRAFVDRHLVSRP
jgi:hypothetical protein